MLRPTSPRVELAAILFLLFGTVSVLFDASHRPAYKSSVVHLVEGQHIPRTAGIGLLPDIGDVSTDLLLLSLVGIGYGVSRLRTPDGRHLTRCAPELIAEGRSPKDMRSPMSPETESASYWKEPTRK